MRTIRISEAVWEEIAKRGKFGETPDDVLKRIFNIEKNISSSHTPKIGRRQRYATQRMTATVANDEFLVKFEGGASHKWRLPSKNDKNVIRKVTEEAIRFAEEHHASTGQINAVRKALTDAGYHLTK